MTTQSLSNLSHQLIFEIFSHLELPLISCILHAHTAPFVPEFWNIVRNGAFYRMRERRLASKFLGEYEEKYGSILDDEEPVHDHQYPIIIENGFPQYFHDYYALKLLRFTDCAAANDHWQSTEGQERHLAVLGQHVEHFEVIVGQFASNALKDDNAVVLAAMRGNPWTFRFASARLQGDTSFVLHRVTECKLPLKLIPHEMFRNRDIVLACVKQKGTIPIHADVSIQDDEEIVRTAVKQDGNALQFASARLRSDMSIARLAAAGVCTEEQQCDEQCTPLPIKFSRVLIFVDPEILKNRAFLLSAIRKDWRQIHCVPKGLQDEELVIEGIRAYHFTDDDKSFQYLPEQWKGSERVIDVLLEWLQATHTIHEQADAVQ